MTNDSGAHTEFFLHDHQRNHINHMSKRSKSKSLIKMQRGRWCFQRRQCERTSIFVCEREAEELNTNVEARARPKD